MSAFNILLTHCRSNMYLIVGICLGLSMSLLFAPMEINDCDDLGETLPFPARQDFQDDYEPKINVNDKPQKAQKTPKSFIRPRYYSTELGIREKLFVGIIATREHLYSRGVALNKTISHLVDKMRFFISIPEGTKPNVTLPGIVGFTDTRNLLKPFHVMKYITDNYLEDYDYFFLIKDTGFVNARKLRDFVGKLSVSQDIHLGIGSEVENYCSLDAGILLSNSIVKEVKSNLDWCVKNTFSDSDDVNFGRCILRAIPVPCANSAQGVNFHSKNLPENFNFQTDFRQLTMEKYFGETLSIFPLSEPRDVYKINAFFTSIELSSVNQEINHLRRKIVETFDFGPENQENMTWPIGNQPGNKAMGRFDILHWSYFNETHLFMKNDIETQRELSGSLKREINQILHAAINHVIEKSKGKLIFQNLLNGYRKFDASRGIDYILDINFTTNSQTMKEEEERKNFIKRIEICKPLGKVEILPVPYVTENSRINMILIVDSSRIVETMKFLEHFAEVCLEKKDKVVLMMVLLYDPNSASKGKEDTFFDLKRNALALSEKYKKDLAKVTWLSIRLPFAFNSIEMEPLLKIAITDLAVRKFSPDSLILFIELGMEIRTDYLNRVRMNTINQWQVFSPIPFVEFHPDIIYTEGKNVEFDVIRNLGRYNDFNFNSVGFYAKDYTSTRKLIEGKIPIVRTDKDIAMVIKSKTLLNSIFEMFVTYSELHAFRAVEPSLKIRYKNVNCNGTRREDIFQNCKKQQNLQLAHRGELTKLILEYQSEL